MREVVQGSPGKPRMASRLRYKYMKCQYATSKFLYSKKVAPYEEHVWQVENNPYDPSMMVFMDYRDYAKEQVSCLEDQYPSFLYVMSMSSTRVFFEVYAMPMFILYMSWSRVKWFHKLALQETCLASKEAVPFDFLKKKLMSRLRTMGIRIVKVYEEVICITKLPLEYVWLCQILLGSYQNHSSHPGVGLYSARRFLAKHETEEPCIWCCCKHGASCYWLFNCQIIIWGSELRFRDRENPKERMFKRLSYFWKK